VVISPGSVLPLRRTKSLLILVLPVPGSRAKLGVDGRIEAAAVAHRLGVTG